MNPARRRRAADLGAASAALAGAIVLNYHAGRFADRAGEAASPAPDLLFRVLPVVDTSAVFTWGFALFLAWLLAAAFWKERARLARIAWAYALLVYVRCFFIVLTPMRLPPEAIAIEGGALYGLIGRFLTFRHDLFFSSHTALPFLGALMFRDAWVRLSFLGFSLVLAAAVLLGRLHYSIDVFAAYFITFAVVQANRLWVERGYYAARERALR